MSHGGKGLVPHGDAHLHARDSLTERQHVFYA
jgi:hypothetical protein